jgi:sec-independent protein translocase protein TatA
MGDLFDSPWKLLIIAALFIVFFGARKLPDAARSLGKSMRILTTEVRGLHEDETEPAAVQQANAQQPAVQQPFQQHEYQPPVQQQPVPQAYQQPVQQQPVAQPVPGNDGTTFNGVPLAETQQTQQPR